MLWEAFDHACRAWLDAARASGDAVEIAIARMLVVIWMDHESGRGDAIMTLSEWARDYLDPTEGRFSPHARAAKARRALEYLVQAFHENPDTNPAAWVAGGRIIPVEEQQADEGVEAPSRSRPPPRGGSACGTTSLHGVPSGSGWIRSR